MCGNAMGAYLRVGKCEHFPAHASPDSLARSPEPLTPKDHLHGDPISPVRHDRPLRSIAKTGCDQDVLATLDEHCGYFRRRGRRQADRVNTAMSAAGL